MSEDLKARRAAAEQAIAKLEEKAAEEREERELEVLEARVAWAAKLGREGIEFGVLDAGAEGPIVYKLAAMVVYKAFHSRIGEGKLTLESQEAFILPCIAFPERP